MAERVNEAEVVGGDVMITQDADVVGAVDFAVDVSISSLRQLLDRYARRLDVDDLVGVAVYEVPLRSRVGGLSFATKLASVVSAMP